MSVMFPDNDTMAIAESAQYSSALTPQQGCALTKIKMPAAMTGSGLTLQGSLNGTDYADVYLDGSVVSFTFGANQVHDVNPRASLGLRSIRLASSGTESSAISIGAVVVRVT